MLNTIASFHGSTPEVGDYQPIATSTLGSAASSITFSSIPSTYQHLQLRIIAQTVSGYPVAIRFNSDTGSNYVYHVIQGNGVSAAVGSATAQTSISGVAAGGATANVFGGTVLDILDYANSSKYKTTRSLAGYDTNSSGTVYFYSGLWLNTAAITSITLIDANGGNMVANTSAALYGIKG